MIYWFGKGRILSLSCFTGVSFLGKRDMGKV